MTEQPKQKPKAPIELKVEYKKLNSFFADYAKNISRGGTFIKTDRALPKGTQFVFRLLIPNRSTPFLLRGVVDWINRSEVQENPRIADRGMGIRFVFDKLEEEKMFQQEVFNLMATELGATLSKQLLEVDLS